MKRTRIIETLVASAAAVVALGAAGCGNASSKDPIMSTAPSDANAHAARDPGAAPSSQDAGATEATRPLARTRAELLQHEGQPIRVEGAFRFPTEQAFARNKLVLDDGTEVILPKPASGPGAAELVAGNDGARVAVFGVVYVGRIPEHYGIKGRTPDPYLFELAAVELLR